MVDEPRYVKNFQHDTFEDFFDVVRHVDNDFSAPVFRGHGKASDFLVPSALRERKTGLLSGKAHVPFQ